jgi:hypothetical protein
VVAYWINKPVVRRRRELAPFPDRQPYRYRLCRLEADMAGGFCYLIMWGGKAPDVDILARVYTAADSLSIPTSPWRRMRREEIDGNVEPAHRRLNGYTRSDLTLEWREIGGPSVMAPAIPAMRRARFATWFHTNSAARLNSPSLRRGCAAA